jgi:hypothetical protein
MLARSAFLFLAIAVASGCSSEGKENYSCRVCGQYDPLFSQQTDEAIEASCERRYAAMNRGVTCSVDNIQYKQLILTFEDCLQAPACVENEVSGADEGFGFDHECHLCGDESEIDSAYDGGVECAESGILRDLGIECPSGERATVVGFSGCESVPTCAEKQL